MPPVAPKRKERKTAMIIDIYRKNLEGEHEKKKEEIFEDASFSSLNNWQNDKLKKIYSYCTKGDWTLNQQWE